MEQSKQFTLEDITYNMTPANAAVAWAALKNALKLVQHVDLSNLGNAGNIGANMLTAILANLGGF